MSKKKKEVLYDVFDVESLSWDSSVTLDEEESRMLSFSEQYDYYTSERDIARKLFKDLLKESQKEYMKESSKWEYGLKYLYVYSTIESTLHVYIR